MKKLENLLKYTTIALGFASSTLFIISYFIFNKLRPKMVRFGVVSPAEESLLNLVGVGLLLFLVFCLLSFLRIAKYLKKARKVSFFSVVLIIAGVLSLLFVFSDIALLNDIGKQYKHGLAQPEWLILYPIMAFQFMTGLALTFSHLFKLKEKDQTKHVARDSNIFLAVQYVGIVCGLMGLFLSSLGFLFPSAWSLTIHTTISSITLLTPYVLAVAYWFITKLQEKNRRWYDEKQMQDIGKSAFLTLIVSVVFMTGLFIANYKNLGGVVSILWLPLYIFLLLFLFSLGNLYFSGDVNKA